MSNSYPIAAFKTLPLPTTVASISGRIAKAFPKNPVQGGSAIQNFFLKDETSGAEVRCGAWDFPQDLLEYQGGYLEVVSADESSMVWKEQRAKGNRPADPKLEMKQSVKILALVKANEYHGPLSVHGRANESGELRFPRVPIPPADTLPRGAESAALDQGQSMSPASTSSVLSPGVDIQNLAVTYQICVEEVHAMNIRLRKQLPEPADEFLTPQMLQAAIEEIFNQATRDGIHRRIDGAKVIRARDPELAKKESQNLLRLADIIGNRDKQANAILVMLKLIEPGQTWHDATDDVAARALGLGFETTMQAMAA